MSLPRIPDCLLEVLYIEGLPFVDGGFEVRVGSKTTCFESRRTSNETVGSRVRFGKHKVTTHGQEHFEVVPEVANCIVHPPKVRTYSMLRLRLEIFMVSTSSPNLFFHLALPLSFFIYDFQSYI